MDETDSLSSLNRVVIMQSADIIHHATLMTLLQSYYPPAELKWSFWLPRTQAELLLNVGWCLRHLLWRVIRQTLNLLSHVSSKVQKHRLCNLPHGVVISPRAAGDTNQRSIMRKGYNIFIKREREREEKLAVICDLFLHV